MARPRTPAIIATVTGLIGTAIAYALWPADGSWSTVPGVIGVAAITIGSIGILYLQQSREYARKAERLMDGEGLMARWLVSQEDWRRFRIVDEKWAKGGGRRAFRPNPDPPSCGIDVFAGREAFVIDGEWLKAKHVSTTLADVVWLPTRPECIEFCLLSGSDPIFLETFRVPVPESARAQGREIFDYWDRKLGPRTEQAEFQREWDYDPARGLA